MHPLTLVVALTLSAEATLTTTSIGPATDETHLEPHKLAQSLTTTAAPTLDDLAGPLRTLPVPADRARAIHDLVALLLTYRPGDGAPQDAKTVLTRRTANCDGYAQLFEALAKRAGLEARLIIGLARDTRGRPQPHAWNVVKLDGAWRFVDVTFDDPSLLGEGQLALRTDYFLTAPDVAVLDHLPTDPRWLLGAPAIDRAHFLSQGPERATTRSQGLALGTITREADELRVPVTNASGRYLLLRLDGQPCGAVTNERAPVFRCRGAKGRLELFTHTEATGLFLSVTEWEP